MNGEQPKQSLHKSSSHKFLVKSTAKQIKKRVAQFTYKIGQSHFSNINRATPEIYCKSGATKGLLQGTLNKHKIDLSKGHIKHKTKFV